MMMGTTMLAQNCNLFNAGPDIKICPGESITLNASYLSSCNFYPVWQGQGNFNSPNSLNSNYTPSQAEIMANEGQMRLKLKSNDSLPNGLMAYDHNSGDEFVHLDVSSGNMTYWNTSSGQDWVAMAYDENRNNLYGFSSISNTKKFYKYDLHMCQIEEVRDYSFDNLAFYACTFDPASDILYAIGISPVGSSGQTLYSIDINTGNPLFIGNLGLNTSLPFINPQFAQGDGINGLAWHPINQTLYGASENNNLYEIDPTTGTTTLIAAFNPWNAIRGMSFDPVTNKLYGTDKNFFVYEINPSNGAIPNVTYTSPSPYNKVSALTYILENAFFPPPCTDTVFFNITDYKVNIIGDSILCEDDSLLLSLDTSSGVAPTSISWAPSQYASNPNGVSTKVSAGQNTMIYLQIDSGLCRANDSISLILNPSPQAGFSFNINGNIVSYTNLSLGQDSVSWTLGDGQQSSESNPLHTFLNNGSYTSTLFVSNSYGCTDSISQEIEIINDVIIIMPNAFTPNSDGNNDNIKASGQGFDTYALQIFNRWGEVIFESIDISKPWDGSYQGSEQPIGLYMYHIVCKKDGQTHIFSGEINLLR